MAIEFGKVEFVHPRDIWAHEADDFTPWLADNLSYVSDAIGIPLELVATEASVERFSADILARDPDGGLALIENQLEGSDHTHLGQILTYLAGLGARTVVWVARDFEEAHLSAVRWLNENTPVDFSFFAVRVSVARIGDSLPVPLFGVLERPNDWDEEVRAVSQPSGDAAHPNRENRDDLSPRGSFNRDFWTHHADRHPNDGVRRGFAGYNPIVPVIGTDFSIKCFHAERNLVGMWVTGSGGRWATTKALSPYLPALAQSVGADPNKSRDMDSAHIELAVDISNPDNWPKAADWLHEKLEIYRRILSREAQE